MAKDNRVLSREHAGHSKLAFPTTQDTALHMDITRWLIPKSDWLCYLQPKIEKLYTVSNGEGNGTPFQYSCLENPMDGGTWWAAVHGVPESQTRLKRLCSSSSIQSAKTRPGAECSSDHQLLIAKFRLKLKKAEKISRPFRYDLNQIPYGYTIEVKSRFKGLDLIDNVPEELWTEVHKTVQEMVTKTSPKKKKCKAKCCLRRPYK